MILPRDKCMYYFRHSDRHNIITHDCNMDFILFLKCSLYKSKINYYVIKANILNYPRPDT